MKLQLFILLAMIFLHIVDDYYLQGVLASMKQKMWWEKQFDYKLPKKYRYDYIAALIVHGFSWSFMVHLPICLYLFFTGSALSSFITVFIIIFLNAAIHSYVDNVKANKHEINLIQDQIIHIFCQIGASWALFVAGVI